MIHLTPLELYLMTAPPHTLPLPPQPMNWSRHDRGTCQVGQLVVGATVLTFTLDFLLQPLRRFRGFLSMKWPQPEDVCCLSVLVRTFGFYKDLSLSFTHTHTHTYKLNACCRCERSLVHSWAQIFGCSNRQQRARHSALLQGYDEYHMLSHTHIHART